MTEGEREEQRRGTEKNIKKTPGSQSLTLREEHGERKESEGKEREEREKEKKGKRGKDQNLKRRKKRRGRGIKEGKTKPKVSSAGAGGAPPAGQLTEVPLHRRSRCRGDLRQMLAGPSGADTRRPQKSLKIRPALRGHPS